MPPLRSSLADFLSAAKAALKRGIQDKSCLSFVIGNESADLDSITSSITFAYLNSLKVTNNAPYIPLLNIHKDDLRLHPELLALLPYAGITERHLLTLDDVWLKKTPGQSHLSSEHTRWILVDHNVLQGDLGRTYGNRVVGCVDHHQNEGAKFARDHDEPHIIEASASCQSLIINYFQDAWESVSWLDADDVATREESKAEISHYDTGLAQVWDSQIAKFAMASILIDSNGMMDMSKITDHDIEAMNYLETKAKFGSHVENTKFDPREFFEFIKNAKSDLTNMNFMDILRKDYKQWAEQSSCIGISVVVKPLEYLIKKAKDKDAFIQELKHFSSKHNLSVMMVMTAYNSPSNEFKRQLLVLAINDNSHNALDKFQDSCQSELSLEAIDIGLYEEHLKVYQQLAVHKSRKQVSQLVRNAMKL